MHTIILHFTAYVLIIFSGPQSTPVKVGSYPDLASCKTQGDEWVKDAKLSNITAGYRCFPVDDPSQAKAKHP